MHLVWQRFDKTFLLFSFLIIFMSCTQKKSIFKIKFLEKTKNYIDRKGLPNHKYCVKV